ncbi:Kelch repeat-containing protein [Aquimarina algiphila]|uniref:hypothetical protein n=1 Tax=Aquimarina algiphila TaxID=2047982 RepID=UPI00232E29BC|nr:hypothetical protein [Aquimarina algiphila]
MLENDIEENPDVYVVGTIHDGISYKATLWKNGEATTLSIMNIVSPLSKNHSSFATAVFVINNDVYVVGNVQSDSENTVAALWKNGVVTALTDGTYTAKANAVFVIENDVYVAGTEMGVTNKFIAKLWKNGKATILVNNSVATSVVVCNNDVYVAGHMSNGTKRTAKLWKNNKEVILLETDHTVANDVYVYENDVYVIGTRSNDTNIATLWKNGIAIPLATGENTSFANALFVLNDDVYVVGKEIDSKKNYMAKLWKNGEAFRLFGGNDAQSVYVFKNTIYVAGCEITHNGTFSMATLWEDNKKITLSEKRSQVYDVFVKKKYNDTLNIKF